MSALDRIRAFEGDVSLYYKPLSAPEPVLHNPDLPLIAASVIKIPIMVTAFDEQAHGRLDFNEIVRLRPEMKMPSCGALTYMHDGLSVTVLDLITLMIILSDNTATNILIDRLTPDRVNACMARLGIPGICLRRRLFEPELSARGIQNTITARGIGMLLDRMARGELLGGDADQRMVRILLDQRLNGKIPFYLHVRDIPCAHKTGEDDGITHDAAIVYTDEPFVLVLLSNHVDVPAFERLMQDAAREWVDAGAGSRH